MRHHTAALLLVLTLPLFGGCGQLGPLYMPSEGAQPVTSEQQPENGEP